MTVLAVPPDLLVTSPEGTRPASEIRPILRGIYDGYVDWDGLTGLDLPACGFIFNIGWHKDMAGHGYEDMCEMAAGLGARLAAEKQEWPTAEAHVRGLPVFSATFEFAVTPERLPVVEHRGGGVTSAVEAIGAGLPEGTVRERILGMAAQARRCESGECGCQ